MCREAPGIITTWLGDRDIVASEAATVLRIFQEFPSGNRLRDSGDGIMGLAFVLCGTPLNEPMGAFRDYPLTGHIADITESTRL